MNKPAFYECGVCGFFHPGGWEGDCARHKDYRASGVEIRFTPEDLDEQYGDVGWVEINPPVPAVEPEPGQQPSLADAD